VLHAEHDNPYFHTLTFIHPVPNSSWRSQTIARHFRG
jgi:hypothetical protein